MTARVEPLFYARVATAIGAVVLAADDSGLRHAFFAAADEPPPAGWIHEPARLAGAVRQLEEYFAGKRHSFDLPLAPRGTEFQRRVWLQLTKIPYGRTITYGELARLVETPQACRAVGNANGRNPLVILQPCHRVVATGSKLGGFSAGLHRKSYLLNLERGGATLFR